MEQEKYQMLNEQSFYDDLLRAFNSHGDVRIGSKIFILRCLVSDIEKTCGSLLKKEITDYANETATKKCEERCRSIDKEDQQ